MFRRCLSSGIWRSGQGPPERRRQLCDRQEHTQGAHLRPSNRSSSVLQSLRPLSVVPIARKDASCLTGLVDESISAPFYLKLTCLGSHSYFALSQIVEY